MRTPRACPARNPFIREQVRFWLNRAGMRPNPFILNRLGQHSRRLLPPAPVQGLPRPRCFVLAVARNPSLSKGGTKCRRRVTSTSFLASVAGELRSRGRAERDQRTRPRARRGRRRGRLRARTRQKRFCTGGTDVFASGTRTATTRAGGRAKTTQPAGPALAYAWADAA
jgi:hypothetical protein